MKASRQIPKRWIAIWGAAGAACILIGLVAASALQQPPAKLNVPVLLTAAPVTATTPTAAAPVDQPTSQETADVAFTAAVADVLHMLDSGVPTDVVKSYIQNSTAPFALTADQIVALHQRKVSPEVIVAMLARAGELHAAATQTPLLPPPGYMVPQPVPFIESPGAYATVEPVAYNPEPGYAAGPYAYDYPYPVYNYSAAPFYGTWWWGPSWGYYPYGHGSAPFHHGGLPGNHPAPYGQPRWPDAYPNHLVTGPNWGADRGFITPSGFSQGRWADAYPNRVVTGPFWGANRGFNGAARVAPMRVGGFARPAAPAAGMVGGGHGRRG